MKKFIAIGAVAVVGAFGVSACGGTGSDTTTVIQQPAPTATTQTEPQPQVQTQTQPQESTEEQLANALVADYVAKNPGTCSIDLDYAAARQEFIQGYLSTNPGNYPNANVVYDALLDYCADYTA